MYGKRILGSTVTRDKLCGHCHRTGKCGFWLSEVYLVYFVRMQATYEQRVVLKLMR